MKNKSLTRMKWVIAVGTTITSFCYILVGMFGYMTFDLYSGLAEAYKDNKNILNFPYPKDFIIQACQLSMLFIVLFASPFCVLPVKDSIE